MNKMIKGAAVASLGVALLLGGGGTLAYWNADVKADAGQIVAGDLNLAAEEGVWTSSLTDAPVNVTDYRVVPGEDLTYTQTLNVTLEGDELEATLTVSDHKNVDFLDNNFYVSDPVITKNDETLTWNELTEEDNGTMTASTTFKFLGEETTGTQSVNATYDFDGITYTLTQNVPGSTEG